MAIGAVNSTLQNSILSNLNNFSNARSSSIKKLSSGFRINKASDDAAGLAVAVRQEAKASALSQASDNVSTGLSMLNTADSGLNNISNMLSRAKELAVQSADSALDSSSRQAISAEFNAIIDEVTRTADSTEFGGQKLINGDLSASSPDQADIQAGDSNTSSDRININVIEGAAASQLGINNADVSTVGGAQNAIDAIDSAIDNVSSIRANVGATQNRLSFANANLGASVENITASVSNIRDVDFAAEVSNLARNQVGQKASLIAIKTVNSNKSEMIGRLINFKA